MTDTRAPQLQFRAAPPTRQSRFRVFFRGLLVVPQLLVVTILGYAVGFLTVLAWFFALVTGRNPFHTFVVGYIRWSTRVTGYSYFLTEKYPPFSFDAVPDYPLDVMLDEGPLGRLSVFFRVVLAVPVLFLSTLVAVGLALVGVVAWLTTLIRGSLPDAFHSGFQATIRYHFRVQAYLLLVQNSYPRGLFGDAGAGSVEHGLIATSSPDPVDASQGVVAPGVSPTPSDAGSDGEPENEAMDVVGPSATPDSSPRFLGALPMAPPLSPTIGAPAELWPLLVSRNGRRVIVAELLAGVVAYVGYIVLLVVLVATVNSGQSWSTLYSGDIAAINHAVATAQSDATSSPTNWSTIATDCSTVATTLTRLNTVPQYPLAGPDKILLQAIRLIIYADRACLSTIAPKRDAQLLVPLSKAFFAGSEGLSRFLQSIP